MMAVVPAMHEEMHRGARPQRTAKGESRTGAPVLGHQEEAMMPTNAQTAVVTALPPNRSMVDIRDLLQHAVSYFAAFAIAS
jgi:hypothetical protein